jgi:hypothetical protein
MNGLVEGRDRRQVILLLDDYVTEDNPARRADHVPPF